VREAFLNGVFDVLDESERATMALLFGKLNERLASLEEAEAPHKA